MKTQLTLLLIAIVFVAIMAPTSLIMAENNSNNWDNTITLKNNVSNMTYGNCVSEIAKIRNDCYAWEKETSKECADKARLGQDKNETKTCTFNYKENKKSCKSSFKEAKINCRQIYQPGFFERMNYAFK